MKSRNGTYVNDQRVDVAKLKSGDRIRVGGVLFSFEQDPNKSAGVALQEMEEEMAQGKGYSTILQEIVGGLEQPTSSGPTVEINAPETQPQSPIKVKTRKPSQ